MGFGLLSCVCFCFFFLVFCFAFFFIPPPSLFSRGLSSRKGCRRVSQPRRALIASACSGDAVKSLREWSPVLTQSCRPAAPAAPRSRHALPLAAAKGAGEAPPKDPTAGRRSPCVQSGQREPWVRHARTPSQAAQLRQGVRGVGCRQEPASRSQGCPLRLSLAPASSGAPV